jgi:hypothetical protein
MREKTVLFIKLFSICKTCAFMIKLIKKKAYTYNPHEF